MRRSNAILVLPTIALGAALYGAVYSPVNWPCQQKEEFLRRAEVVSSKKLSVGITQSSKLTMTDGTTTHAAHQQSIDEYRQRFESRLGTELNFRDSYKYNIAAYRLDRLLGMNMVPVSIERSVGGRSSAVTWWVDRVLMMERDRFKKKIEPPNPDAWNSQMYRVRVFNELIYNTDPNLGNVLITEDWDIWIIDFTRAFRLHKTVRDKRNLTRIDPELLARLKTLDESTLMRELSPYLRKPEIAALVARRDWIVKFFERRIAQLGEEAVLSDPPERQEETLRGQLSAGIP